MLGGVLVWTRPNCKPNLGSCPNSNPNPNLDLNLYFNFNLNLNPNPNPDSPEHDVDAAPTVA